MRLGHVIGRVTLSKQDPAYHGGRFLLVQPFGPAQFRGAAMTPLANRMEEPSTDKAAPFPAHPGAVAYLDGEEETFLDKYSDFIYIGAMLLSVLASAAAALASAGICLNATLRLPFVSS